MEYACFINNIEDLKSIPPQFTRVYFGEELCENNFPNYKTVMDVYNICIEKRINFTLVSCVFTDGKLSKFIKLMNKLESLGNQLEIVVNDYGVLNYCINEKFTNIKIIIGRLLNKASKTPRYANIKKQLNEYQKEALGQSLFMNRISSNYFSSDEVYAYEIDNVHQLIIPNEYGRLVMHLVVPYVLITITRNCLYNGIESNGILTRERKKCKRECSNYNLQLFHNTILTSLYSFSSGLFYKNEEIKNNIYEKVSRIVTNSIKYKIGGD